MNLKSYMAWFKLVVMLGVIKDDFAGGGKKKMRADPASGILQLAVILAGQGLCD
jgi:hypothetical protein